MSRTIIATEDAPAAIGPYSQAIRAGELLFLSGQIPLDPATGRCCGQVSHGEMIREGNDERMILDPDNLMFFYQGLANADNRGDYGRLSYKLGLLRAVKEQ